MSEISTMDIISNALRHYSKILNELQDDEDVKKGNASISDDIKINSDNVLRIANTIDELKSSNTVNDNRDIICSALTLYQRDLEKSKKIFTEKLGKDIQFDWYNVNDELQRIQIIKDAQKCPKDHIGIVKI